MNNSVRTTTLLNGREIFHHISVYCREHSELDIIFFSENGALTAKRKTISFSDGNHVKYSELPRN